MNYRKLHNSIINNAITRSKVKDQYKENHHIIPKSMGGTDKKENIVQLTAREHFIVHWLLKKIHQNKSMTYAFFSMTKLGNESQQRYTSHSFKYARESMSKMMSERVGDKHPMHGITGDDNPNTGSKRTEESKKKMSIAMTDNRVGSKNHKSKPVKNLDTGDVFESVRQAQLKTTGNVSYAIRSGGTAGGHRYSYVNDGEQLSEKLRLKGYMKGDSHINSVSIRNITTGEEFSTIKAAGESISKTGTAISWSIRNNKEIGGFKFERINNEKNEA